MSKPASPESRSAWKRDTSCAPMAASPAPRPPDAPVPAPRAKSMSRACGNAYSANLRAQFSKPLSSSATCCGEAPFWGPKTRATPRSPVRMLCALSAITIFTFPSRNADGSPLMSNVATSARQRPPCPTSLPWASAMRTPRACNAPRPPSLVPESPQPIKMVWMSCSSAAWINSPTPRVVVRVGSRMSRGTRRRPAAAAISTTATPCALPPSKAKCDSTGSPTGPVTVRCTRRPPVDSASICAVPSPPSGTGTVLTRAPGMVRRTPAEMARATVPASSDSLNPAGATRIFLGMIGIGFLLDG